ncbi:MAG TPA: dTDP-4-dehydrorhamnose reductase [Ilumatobacter sp.]
MRVLITGAGGQLGHDLALHCAVSGDDVVGVGREGLDIGDRDMVHAVVGGVRPDVVVNAAAWTAVDACEGDRDRAFRVNALGPRWLREAADRHGAHLVQISTDYVFDGTLERPYHEWDRPDPPSVYGQSKLAGEHESGAGSTVIRTSWVSGANGNNIVKTVLRLAVEQPVLRFVDDQRGCPTFTADLATMVRRLALDRRAGVYHVTNAGAVSWYEFVCDIVSAAGRDPAMVEPITTADLRPPRPAPRPANSVLDGLALRQAGITGLRHYREPLHELIDQLTS